MGWLFGAWGPSNLIGQDKRHPRNEKQKSKPIWFAAFSPEYIYLVDIPWVDFDKLIYFHRCLTSFFLPFLNFSLFLGFLWAFNGLYNFQSVSHLFGSLFGLYVPLIFYGEEHGDCRPLLSCHLLFKVWRIVSKCRMADFVCFFLWHRTFLTRYRFVANIPLVFTTIGYLCNVRRLCFNFV